MPEREPRHHNAAMCLSYANELDAEREFNYVVVSLDADERNAWLAHRAQIDHNIAMRSVLAHGFLAIINAIDEKSVR